MVFEDGDGAIDLAETKSALFMRSTSTFDKCFFGRKNVADGTVNILHGVCSVRQSASGLAKSLPKATLIL